MNPADNTPDPGEALEKACSEFCDAWLDGEAPDLESYCREHPSIEHQLRERIEEFMSAVQQLERESGSRSGVSGSYPEQEWRESDEVEEGRLGDFILNRELGRGGMGVVYEARQLSLNRMVALKVLPAHLTLRKEAVERFRREASSGAKLKHPGIVEIHTVGEDRGNHFFAMEFVEGAPLDKVIRTLQSDGGHRADGKRMGEVVTLERFRLSSKQGREYESTDIAGVFWNKSYIEVICRIMVQVLEALDHAHIEGVTHRDVKPSNILVRRDGSAVLTDFGLAREEGLPSLTMTGELAGTAHYISPEQASPRRKGTDHRVDLFSLGATFYELITLKKAFDGKTTQEVLAKILGKEPNLPRTIDRTIPRDLETICLKALEKDPDRRYLSAREFLDDLNRFLEFRPIQAQPVGVVTRTYRLVRRNPAWSAMFVLLFLLVVVGPTVFAIQQKLFSDEVQKALAETEEERKAKEKELVLSNTVTKFLTDLFQRPHPDLDLGKRTTAYELLLKGAAAIDNEFEDQPEIRVRLISVMAETFVALGDFNHAERLLKNALNTCLDSLGDDHEQSFSVLYQLGEIYIVMDRSEEAEALINRALAATSSCADEAEFSRNLMATNSLASLRRKQGNLEEAEGLYRDSWERSEATRGKMDFITIQCLMYLGYVCMERNRFKEAESLLLDCLDRCRESFGEDDAHTDFTSVALGELYLRMRNLKKAESHLMRVAERRRRVYGAMAPTTHTVTTKLATVYMRMGRFEEAEPLLADAIECLSEKLGEYHTNTLDSAVILARLYMMTDRSAEAAHLARTTLEIIPAEAPGLGPFRMQLESIEKAARQRE